MRKSLSSLLRFPMTLFGVVALAGFVLGHTVSIAVSQSNQVGVAAAVRGSVDVQSGGLSRTPSSGEAMLLGDRVQTGAASGLQVLLLDESVFTVGENNDLVIDRFVYDPDQGVGELAARTTRGALRFVSGGIGSLAPDRVTIGTPSATIGTRGTSVDVIVGEPAIALARALGLIGPNDPVDPEQAVFVILRGPTTSYNGITNRGRVLVSTSAGSQEVRREGFGVFVPFTGAPPSAPVEVAFTINQAVIDQVEIPEPGDTRRLDGIDLTQLPRIDVTPSDLAPGPEGPNPDVTGGEFDAPCVTTLKSASAKNLRLSPCSTGGSYTFNSIVD